jgi:hypothetical protein
MTGLCDFYGRRAGATAIFARWRSPTPYCGRVTGVCHRLRLLDPESRFGLTGKV